MALETCYIMPWAAQPIAVWLRSGCSWVSGGILGEIPLFNAPSTLNLFWKTIQFIQVTLASEA